jgi:flagellar hook-associated protein 1 FlgK
MGIASTFHIAAQALRNHQAAIQTTGHNLANVATPGFARQRVELVSQQPSFEGGVFLGQGSAVGGVQRIVDRFLESELLGLNRSIGFTEAEHQALTAIQEAFPVSGGIDAALSAFFGALSDLANNPAGLAERVSVIGKAKALGESLRQTRDVLNSAQKNLDEEMRGAAQRLNLLLEQVATLNQQINATEVNGAQANDFRDQRQTRLQEIARLTGAIFREEQDGQVTVIAGGLLLVSANRFAAFDTNTLNPSGLHLLNYRSPDGLQFDATNLVSGGKIGSGLSMRDSTLPQLIARLDQIAKTLVDQVNAQHALGFTLTGAAGGNFFTPIAAVAGAAAVVQVDPSVVADPRLIAAAGSAATVPGDNRNALALVNLKKTPFAVLGGLTLQDSFLAIVGDVGSRVQTAQAGLELRQQVLTQTQARREAVSGVSIDEEMTKLILFQRAFEASSLLVRTTDEIYAALIEMAR